MKWLTGIIGYSWLLLVLFSTQQCRAEIGLLASVENDLSAYEGEGQLIVPNLKDNRDADTSRNRKQLNLDKSSNRSAKNDGFSSADPYGTRTGMNDSADNLRKGTENTESPFQHYLLLAIVIGVIGLGLIAVGVVQWWQRRKLRQNWLFPAVMPDDGEPFTPAASSPAPLIAKKHLEESLQDKDAQKHAQRRAA